MQLWEAATQRPEAQKLGGTESAARRGLRDRCWSQWNRGQQHVCTVKAEEVYGEAREALVGGCGCAF